MLNAKIIKTILVLGMLIILSASANAAYLSLNAGAENNELRLGGGKVQNQSGVDLPVGSVLQYIYAGPNGIIDPPNPGGGVTGDDVLLATKSVGADSVYAVFTNKAGEFYHNASGAYSSGTPKVYVRAWNASTIDLATHYGNSSLLDPAMGTNPPSPNEVAIASFATTTSKPVPNNPPVLGDKETDPRNINEDAAYSHAFSYTDADGDTVNWTLNAGGADFLTLSNGVLSGTPDNGDVGTYTVKVEINDGKGGTDSQTFILNVVNVNDAPVLVAIDNKTVASGSTLGFTLSASDVDTGDTLTYSSLNLPTGASLNPTTGVFSWTPASDNSQMGTYNVTFAVADDHGGSDSKTAQITVTKLNHAPVANNQSVAMSEGTSVTITLAATDADNDGLTYSIVANPAEGSLSNFNVTAVTVTYTPMTNYNGADLFTFKVNDGLVDSITAAVSITVNSVNDAPVLSTVGNKSIRVGNNLTFNLSAADVDNDNLTYSVTDSPAGATLIGSEFSWTPSGGADGTYPVTFTVSDGHDGSDSETINIVVYGSITKASIVPEAVTVTPTQQVKVTINYKDKNDNTVETEQTTWTAPEKIGEYDISSLLSLPAGIEKTGITRITVVSGPLYKITIADLSVEIIAGTDVAISASAGDAWGNPVTTPISLTSASGTIKANLLTGLTKAGEVTVKAKAGNKSDEKKVKVVPAALYSITVSPDTVTLEQGQSATFTAKAFDVYGNERSEEFTYSSKLGNSSTITANAEAGDYTLKVEKGTVFAAAKIKVTSRYEEVMIKVENSKAVLTAKDAAGKEVALSNYDEITYDVTGKEDGNKILTDGTFVEGDKEGGFTLTASVRVGERILTGSSAVDVNKGAPRMQIRIDEQDLRNNIAISSKPKLNIDLSDGNGIKAVRIFIDGKELKGLALSAQEAGSSTVSASFTPEIELSSGIHTLLIEAEDGLGTKGSISALGLQVYAELEIQGKPMNYPNPFKPGVEKTTINYKLTKDADVKLMIYDLTGRLVYTQVFAAKLEEGGKAGENEPTWDGKATEGNVVGNGVYVYFLTSGGKVIGSGEMAVYE